jgi:drug/metabolite transporter (DMT)-like permease
MLLAHEWQASTLGGDVGLGITLAVGGILAASFANVVQANKTGRAIPMVSLLAWAMLYGVIFDLFFAFNTVIFDLFFAFTTAGPPPFPTHWQYWAGTVYLALIGSVVTFPLHYNLVRQIGAGRTAYNSIVTVCVAMLLSTLFEGYIWTPLTAGGMALALLGMVLALRARKQKSIKVGQATAFRHDAD